MSCCTGFPRLFPLVAVVGPTATGKTAVSIRLAAELHAEIVNLDSVQVYKGLDIGSAKPTPREQAGIVHHLLDIREPFEPLDAASFSKIAARRAETILERGRNCIFVGGTGFYLNALLSGLSHMPGHMPGIRSFLRDMHAKFGPGRLHWFLQQADPDAARRIHPNDTYRLVRALEVYMSSGMTFSSWCARIKPSPPAFAMQRGCVIIGLAIPRESLYRRIDERVDQMIDQGFVEEVKGLLKKGLDPGLKALQSLGYRHIIRYLQGGCTLKEAIADTKRDTRRYAKRQFTWYRKDPRIRWFDPRQLLACENIWEAVN